MEELNQMFFSVSTHWALVAHPIPLTPVLQGQSKSDRAMGKKRFKHGLPCLVVIA